MERVYPYLTRNLVRPDMAPIPVPNQAYDEALCDEWWNPYGVERRGGKPAKETRKPGRPRKEDK